MLLSKWFLAPISGTIWAIKSYFNQLHNNEVTCRTEGWALSSHETLEIFGSLAGLGNASLSGQDRVNMWLKVTLLKVILSLVSIFQSLLNFLHQSLYHANPAGSHASIYKAHLLGVMAKLCTLPKEIWLLMLKQNNNKNKTKNNQNNCSPQYQTLIWRVFP